MPVAATALIDTGPLAAILGKNDSRHGQCMEVFRNAPAPLLTCWPVLTETAYLLGESSLGAKKLFELIRTGALALLPLGAADVPAIEAILAKYEDQGFQLADACLMHLAERDGIQPVLTLDRKDFSVFRMPKGESLSLLP